MISLWSLLLLVMTQPLAAEEPQLWLSFDSRAEPLGDSGSMGHTARWEGDATWVKPGLAHLPNSAEGRQESRILVDGDDLAVDGDFTLEVRFRLNSIGSWWGAYNGTPRAVARPGDGEFYEGNYYVQVQSFGEKGNLLAGGFFNGEDWDEIQMGDRRGEPGVELATWYTVLLQHVSAESTLTLVVLREDEGQPFFAERKYGVRRPFASSQPLVIGHGGKDSKDSWLDGDVDYVKFWKQAVEVPALAQLDLRRPPLPISLKGLAASDGVHLTWNQSPDEVGLLFRQFDADSVAMNEAAFLDSCRHGWHTDTPLPAATLASYAVRVCGRETDRVSHVANVPLVPPDAPTVEATFPTSAYLTWDLPAGGVESTSFAVYATQSKTRRFPAGLLRTSLTVWDLADDAPCTLALAVVTAGGSESPRSAPVVAALPPPSQAVTSCAVMNVLVTIPTNTPGGQIGPEEVERIRAGMELTRQFYWRNSGCRLDIPLEFLALSRPLADEEFGNDGLLWPQFLEPVLREERIDQEPYGLFFATYPPLEGGGNYGAMTMFGGRGYSFATYPLRTSVVYPGTDPSVNYAGTWLLCHELQHSVDLVGYEKSGCDEMWHGDKPLDCAVLEGQQFSYQAGIFRSFDRYLEIKEPWGHLIEIVDADGDGFPDMDSRLPMDEARFGSSPASNDTDGDGLDDLGEFTAGIYTGSDPSNPDTDGDGILDGDDPLPLYDFAVDVPCADLTVGEAVAHGRAPHSSRLFWTGDTSFHCSTWLGWQDDALVVALRMSTPTKTVVELDAANDGWWHGKDNYFVRYDAEHDSLSVAVMDATRETRQHNLESGGYEVEMWDSDPRYVAWRGRLVEPESITCRSDSDGGGLNLEIAIPPSDRTGLTLKAGETIRVRIYFPDVPASLFENYELIPVTLAAKDR
jgi:hypothetical protein